MQLAQPGRGAIDSAAIGQPPATPASQVPSALPLDTQLRSLPACQSLLTVEAGHLQQSEGRSFSIACSSVRADSQAYQWPVQPATQPCTHQAAFCLQASTATQEKGTDEAALDAAARAQSASAAQPAEEAAVGKAPAKVGH